MKYKVGDKVRVRKDLKIGELYGVEDFIGDMKQLKGKVVTIDEVCENGTYFLKEFNYLWTDKMLEPVEDIIEYKGKKYDVKTTRKDFNNDIIFICKKHKEEILDEVEKRYLSAVIKPFRKKVKFIIKHSDADAYFIQIELEHILYDDDDENIILPYFQDKTMYKGMKNNKEYTLEELGLK